MIWLCLKMGMPIRWQDCGKEQEQDHRDFTGYDGDVGKTRELIDIMRNWRHLCLADGQRDPKGHRTTMVRQGSTTKQAFFCVMFLPSHEISWQANVDSKKKRYIIHHDHSR